MFTYNAFTKRIVNVESSVVDLVYGSVHIRFVLDFRLRICFNETEPDRWKVKLALASRAVFFITKQKYLD